MSNKERRVGGRINHRTKRLHGVYPVDILNSPGIHLSSEDAVSVLLLVRVRLERRCYRVRQVSFNDELSDARPGLDTASRSI